MKFEKGILLGLLGIVCLLSSCSSSLEEQINEEEIKLAIREQQDAWNDGDVVAFMSWYKKDPEISFATKKGVVRGYDQLLNRYLKSYPNQEKMGRLEFEILEYIPAGDSHAVLVGKWTLYRKTDKPNGYFSLLWERTDSGWKIIHDHTS